LINARAYKKVSAEIYNRMPEGVPGQGKALRRVVLMGGYLPHIKSLNDIPWADYEEFSEGGIPSYLATVGTQVLDNGVVAVFSEVKPMNRNEMINALLKANIYKVEFFERLTDEQVAQCFKVYSEHQARIARLEEENTNIKEFAEHCGVDIQGNETDEFWKHKGSGSYREHYSHAMKEHHMRTLHRGKKLFGEDYEHDVEVKDRKKEKKEEHQLASLSEAQVTDLVAKAVSEALAKNNTEIKTQLAAAENQISIFQEATKRDAVNKFVETRRASGKITASELDPGPNKKPTLIDRLMMTDGKAVIHTFSENGRDVKMTALDLAMDEIDRRQARPDEKLVPGTKDGKPVEVNRKDWAKGTYAKFNEYMDKAGISEANFIESAEKASKESFERMQKEFDSIVKAA
jgi:hypothetical protein